MNLQLDHFFILTDKPKETGDLLVSMGLNESFSRDHKGQGTSNRRFEFSNGMLEILYIRDSKEANNGPAKNLKFVERVESKEASPFGIILTRTENAEHNMPFSGWEYQPDYFPPPNAFHIGNNSESIQEPLCIYVPFIDPANKKEIKEPEEFSFITHVDFFVPVEEFSNTIRSLDSTDRVQVALGDEHLAILTLDNGNLGISKDLRPNLPLIIKW